MDDLNTLWSKLLSDYARIKNKAAKLSGGYQAFIDAADALIRQCYGALSSLTDNEYTVDGGTSFTNIDVITELVTESGSIVSIDNKLRDRSIEELTVDIEPVQSGSGDPSPDNVRPITGWDSVTVKRTGKNLLPTYTPETSYNGVTFTINNDGSVIATGKATATANKSSTFVAPVTGEYKLTGCPANGSGGSYQIWIRDEITGQTTGIEDRGNGSTGTLIKGNTYKVFLRINNGYTANSVHFYPMLRLVSEPDDTYEPYNGNVYEVSLSDAGTVYGGTLDVISGALTVGFRAFVLSSDGIGSYSFNSANGQLRITGLLSMPNTLENICSHYKSFSGSFANLPDKSFMASSSTIAVKDSDYTSLESWKTYLDAQLSANTPVQVRVKLSEAQTIQLTPQEIKTLIGNNNIWADAGDVTVTYPAKSDKDCNGGYPGS